MVPSAALPATPSIFPLQLRPAVAEDEPFLLTLFVESRSEAERAVYRAHPAGDQLLEMQYKARSRAYTVNFPGAEYHIVLAANGEAIGQRITEKSAVFRVISLALLPAYRQQGIGTALLRGVQAEAARAHLSVRLAVATGSPARRLYERLGFRAIHVTETEAEMEFL